MDDLVKYFGTRPLYEGELKYFQSNPTVAGMATEDNKIILNPYSQNSPEEQQAVARNEAIRLFLKQTEYTPDFDLTKKQQSFFKGSEYEKNQEEAKKSIIARILSGDPSVGTASSQQSKEAENILKQIMEFLNKSNTQENSPFYNDPFGDTTK